MLLVCDALYWLRLDVRNLSGGLLLLLDVLHEGEREDFLDRIVVA